MLRQQADHRLSEDALRKAWGKVFHRYKDRIEAAARRDPGERILELDYHNEVCLTSKNLGNAFPVDGKRAWETGQEVLDAREETHGEQVALALTNTGDSFTRPLHRVGSQDYGQLVKVTGIIRNVSKIRERVRVAAEECLRCGNIMEDDQEYDLPGNKKQVQGTCPQCEKKTTTRWAPERTVMEDQRAITITSPVGDNQPDRRLPVLVHRDLVHACQAGDEVNVLAFKDIERDSKKNTHRPFLVAVNITPVQERKAAKEASQEHLERWRSAIQDSDFEQHLIETISPNFHGHEPARKALALTLFSSPRQQGKRGDLNILLAGDPGTGKSDLLGHLDDVAPRSVTANGSSDTGVGLTAAAVQDDLMGGWTVQSGALPLASGGLCLIDELDKASDDDAEKILEAAEDQKISFNRAGINTTLRAEASIVAAANPEGGRWNDNQEASIHQLDILPPLLSRFDGIFLFHDQPDQDRDEDVAEAVLDAHTDQDEDPNPLTRDLVARIAWYAKQNIQVTLPDAPRDRFKEAYLDLRDQGMEVGVGPRQLESMIRFAKARARCYLREEVTVEDAQWSISLVKGWIENAARGPKGVVDITHIDDPEKASQRERVEIVREHLRENQAATLEEIARETALDMVTAEKTVEYMERQGEVYRPDGNAWELVT